VTVCKIFTEKLVQLFGHLAVVPVRRSCMICWQRLYTLKCLLVKLLTLHVRYPTLASFSSSYLKLIYSRVSLNYFISVQRSVLTICEFRQLHVKTAVAV